MSRRPGSRKPRLPATTRMRRQPRGSSLKLLARTAGDLALVLGATGGVFLRGGVLHALARLIEPEAFRRHFTGKAPVDAFARAMPLALMLEDAVILRAMAGIGADPQRFALAYSERLWRA